VNKNKITECSRKWHTLVSPVGRFFFALEDQAEFFFEACAIFSVALCGFLINKKANMLFDEQKCERTLSLLTKMKERLLN
jgi:hypothetical protein